MGPAPCEPTAPSSAWFSCDDDEVRTALESVPHGPPVKLLSVAANPSAPDTTAWETAWASPSWLSVRGSHQFHSCKTGQRDTVGKGWRVVGWRGPTRMLDPSDEEVGGKAPSPPTPSISASCPSTIWNATTNTTMPAGQLCLAQGCWSVLLPTYTCWDRMWLVPSLGSLGGPWGQRW